MEVRDALEVADDHLQEDEVVAAANGAPLALVLEHLIREREMGI